MKCPKCGADYQWNIKDSRSSDYTVKRRRECRVCGFRFSTIEIPAPDTRTIKGKEDDIFFRRLFAKLDGKKKRLIDYLD